MATLSEFRIFSELPPELRRKIWLSVPQPERLIGQLPCSKCWKFQFARGNPRTSTRTQCPQHKNHPDWSLRWVLNDPDPAVFPPLQACQESRATWLPRYFAPPRYLRLPHQGAENSQTNSEVAGQLRFDIPYVSYELDTFAIFDVGISSLGFEVDPLLGFDRRFIQRIAISENAWSMVEAVVAINPQSLPGLQSLSILVAAPTPQAIDDGSSSWQEMHSVDMQRVKCDVVTIPKRLVDDHPMFSRPEKRLNHLTFSPESRLRQLSNYKLLFEAWWWHSMHWDSNETRIVSEAPWWDFCTYVFEQNGVCPLDRKWCPGNHGHQEMLEGGGGLNVGVKLLVERGCLRDLHQFAVLDMDVEWWHVLWAYKQRRAADFEDDTAGR